MSEHNFTRRSFMKATGLGAAALSMPEILGESRAFAEDSSEKKPNIIYIMADDLGYTDLDCYGQKQLQTPNVDRLASEGVRFTDCYAGSAVCAPCRSVLMTGQHTGHTRVRDNKAKVEVGATNRRVPLLPEDVTVADVLKKAGYATGITGKWGLGEPDTVGVPNRHGFDEWFGYLNQAHAHTYYPDYLWKNEERYPIKENENGGRKVYSHDLCTNFALDFIREHKEGPFFLYLAWTIPHGTYEIPDLGAYADKDWPDEAKNYAAMVARMDRDVGRILSLLKDEGIDDNTLVFFCSDNGAAREWEGLFDSCGPLRGRKSSLYEGGIRVPMIARWPGHVPAGKVDGTPWYFADVLPTLAALAGAQPPKQIDGVNVLPTILGKDQPELATRIMYWEFPSRGYGQAARMGNWKAYRPGQGKDIELYNLAEDIGETKDLAAQNPDLVAKFEAFFESSHVDSPNWPMEKS